VLENGATQPHLTDFHLPLKTRLRLALAYGFPLQRWETHPNLMTSPKA